MRYSSPSRFGADCGRLRLLAHATAATAACIGVALAISWAVPFARGTMVAADPRSAAALLRLVPTACYLLGIGFVGQAMGRLAKGRPVQPVLADALRRIGWTIGMGGVLSVFVVTNAQRALLGTHGGYLNFDVGGMTLAVTGGALILLGHVVDEAVRAQDELDEIV